MFPLNSWMWNIYKFLLCGGECTGADHYDEQLFSISSDSRRTGLVQRSAEPSINYASVKQLEPVEVTF